MVFPDDFAWGTGQSDVSRRGPAPASDLAAWAPASRGGLHRDVQDATAFGEDLAAVASLGLTHRRHVLEWSRLEPEPGRRDGEAVEQARAELVAAAGAGISVWGCLHDGSLPGWFSVDEHGFADDRARRYHWARHCEWVGETFGDLVHGWMPVFEPSRWALDGWITRAGPPGRSGDVEGFTGALAGILQATVEAALRLRQDGHPVSSAHWAVPVFAARPSPDAPPSPSASAMASVTDTLLRGSWLRLLAEDSLHLPGRGPIAVPGARQAFDLMGFTYRHAVAVDADGDLHPFPQNLPTGPDGQVLWAHGLGIAAHDLADAAGDRPLLVAGVGCTTDDEDRRADYLREVLADVAELSSGGATVAGLWWNTPIDPRPGPVGPGLLTADRHLRPAGALLAAVTAGGPVPS